MAKTYTGGNRPAMPDLSFDYTEYRPDRLMQIDERALRSEYSRLRSIAQKRLSRLEQSEFAKSQVVAYNAGKYLPLKAVSSKRELSHLLVDVVDFLTAQRSSVSGMRDYLRRSVKTLKESGYDFVDKSNFNAFGNFMGWAKSFYGDKLPDSNRVVGLFKWAQESKVSPGSLKKNFQYYLENFEKGVKPKTRTRGKMSSEQWAEAFRTR